MTLQATFLTQLTQLLNLQDELKAFRSLAWNKLLEIGLPHQKWEAFQYLKLKNILNASYLRASFSPVNLDLIQEAKLSAKSSSYLVFYNGHFLPEHSSIKDERIIIKSLDQAFLQYGVFFKNQFQKWIKEEKDPFVLSSIALHSKGAFVYAPNQHTCVEPLTILEINDSKQAMCFPFLVVSCGKNSNLNLIHQILGQADFSSLVTATTFFVIEAHAQASYIKHTLNKEPSRLDALRVEQKKGSMFSSLLTAVNTLKVRNDIKVELLESFAQAQVTILSALKNQQEAHAHILIEHKAEECQSRQLVKNIYDDKSLGSFEGKIWVDSMAQKTNAYQLNQNCLLSDQAISYSKPNLEIFADDVKASHGSTTGQLNKDHLFYLQSRGLSLESAKQMILKAFCYEIIEKIEPLYLKEQIQNDLTRYFTQ